MNKSEIGTLGELKVIEQCIKHGIQVFRPFGDGNRIDLILIVNGKCIRTQVKSSTMDEDGVITFKTCSTSSNHGENPTHYYTKDDIDIYMFYSYAYDEVYCMKVEEVAKGSTTLRHKAPKVWSTKTRMTTDYPFEKVFEYSETI